MQASQHCNQRRYADYFKEQILDPLTKSPFSLSIAKIMTDQDLFVASYSQKHHLLLVSSLEGKLLCYDAKTLPEKYIKTLRLDGTVLHISYYHETDTFIIGCNSGSVFTYKACSDELKMVQKGMHTATAAVGFLDSSYYAFGFKNSEWLSIGNLDQNNMKEFDLKDSHCTAIHPLAKKNLLFAGLSNGLVRIFLTKQLPNLKVFYSFKAHQGGKQVNVIQSLQVNGKEYIVMSGQDGTMKIWHFIKGRMRLLKVIQEKVTSLVYLEKYKMLVTNCEKSKEIKFWKLPCGKLERRLDFSQGFWRGSLFLMKDKNIIVCVASGALGSVADPLGVSFDAIEFIQINHEETL